MSSSSMSNSSHKLAVVTGGSRGLGRSTVLSLAARGVDSIFTYHSNHAEAQGVIAAVQAVGRRAIAVQLDVGETDGFGAFVEKVSEGLTQFGAERFDYLVNNAGTSHHKAIMETAEDELDSLYRVHVKGAFFLTQKLLPLMQDGGRIINVSTGLTRFSMPGSAAYASMKGAVEVLTRYLAKELGARRIVVNTIAPGAIETDFSGGIVRDNPDLNRRIGEMTALGRPGVPDDIGPMVAALLGDENRWVNGQRIEVSGGMLI